MNTRHVTGMILSLMILLAIAPFATAGNVSLFAYWVGNNSQTKTVTQGDLVQLMVTADSLAPAFSMTVDLWQGSVKVNTLLKLDNATQDSYSKMLTLNTASLLGTYTVKATITS